MILGRRATGKTDFSFLLAEMLFRLGLIKYFASNTLVYEAPFLIDRITNLEDLESWCKNNNGPKLYILDEAGKALRRRTPMSGLNIQLIDNLQILRKYKLSLILIAPNEKYIDNAALGSDILDGHFIKPYFSNPKVAIYSDRIEDLNLPIKNIPRTGIKFDTWDSAPFKLKSPTAKPRFKDAELNMMLEWAQGKPIKDLNIHHEAFKRRLRKFVLEVMTKEAQSTSS